MERKKTPTDVVVPIVRNQNMICFMQKLGALFESAVTNFTETLVHSLH